MIKISQIGWGLAQIYNNRGHLQSALPQEKISIYAENGLWYDTVTEFQQLLQTNPNSLSVRSDWESLLNSVGLESVVE